MADDRREKKSRHDGERKGVGRKIKEVGSELKKVSWPSFSSTLKSTGVVLAVVGIFLLVILAFDLALSYGVFTPLTRGDEVGTLPQSIREAVYRLSNVIQNVNYKWS